MLATHWPFTPTHQAQHAYIPTRPSPLSPRSANAPSRPLFTRYAMSKSTFSSSDSENATPFSKRAVKSNPLFAEKRRSPDEQRERRRDIFMKKVEQGREDKKWAGRTDQILRTDYLTQKRREEAERARQANQFTFEDLDEEDLPGMGDADMPWPSTPRLNAQPDDAQEVDVVEQMEEQELRALIGLADQQQQEMPNIPSSPTRYGSDEEDFDDIFMELMSSQEAKQQQTRAIVAYENADAEMMDMT